jgi:hypothetical protein
MKQLLFQLRHGPFAPAWGRLSLFLMRIGGPRFAAFLSSLSIDWGESKFDRKIFCLHRESFVKDIAELKERTNFDYPILTAGYTRLQMAWTPDVMCVQTFYQVHCNDYPRAIEKSTQYALFILNRVKKKGTLAAVASANFDYWQDVGFKIACKQLGIPFIVLSREHPIIPHACDIVLDWYVRSNYRFNGDLIAVAGQSSKIVLDKAAVCTEDKIIVTGLPRYDAWVDVDVTKPLAERRFITLLTFSQGYFADETFKDVLHTFVSAAMLNAGKSVEFLVKTKDIEDTCYILKMLQDTDLSLIRIDHNITLYEALSNSRLVINYNSLSLVEAALARSAIVIPAWGECSPVGEKTMYRADEKYVAEAVEYARSVEEMKQLIFDHVTYPHELLPDNVALNFINSYVYMPSDGSTISQKFEESVEKCLQKTQ